MPSSVHAFVCVRVACYRDFEIDFIGVIVINNVSIRFPDKLAADWSK